MPRRTALVATPNTHADDVAEATGPPLAENQHPLPDSATTRQAASYSGGAARVIPLLRSSAIVVVLMVGAAGLSTGTASAATSEDCYNRLQSINAWSNLANTASQNGFAGVARFAAGVASQQYLDYTYVCSSG